MYLPSIVAVLSLALSGLAAPAGNDDSKLKCSNLNIPLSVTAEVRKFPSNFNASTFNYSSVTQLPKTSISGKYDIGASYCAPTKAVPSHSSMLQILIHGATYTRTYWSGLKIPPQSINGSEYSYIDFVAKEGYATLSIDRLCNGDSTHPNGTLACQIENQVEVLKALVDEAKSGKLVAKKHFDKVILVGHSLGSVLIQAFLRAHPKAVDQVVFTGFSSEINARALITSPAVAVANQAKPKEYGDLNDYYLLVNNQTFFIDIFFFGEFNENVAKYNYRTEGTVNLWEAATIDFGQLPTKKYTGNVIVLNGEEDGAVCGGNCGTGKNSLTAQVSKLVPNAKKFQYSNTADTGHCLNLHFTAKKSYAKISAQLQAQGN